MPKDSVKVVARNKKARHEYFIEETYETGIELFGTEVKSIRMGKLNLLDAYATIRDGQIWVVNMHISPYEKGNIHNRDPLRTRKLLMHKAEIRRLLGYVTQKGLALIPLCVYLKGSLVKVELSVAKGKKLYDKRQSTATRDAQRRMQRAARE